MTFIIELLDMEPNEKNHSVTAMFVQRDQYGRFLVDDGTGVIPVTSPQKLITRIPYRIIGKLVKSKVGGVELDASMASPREGLDMALLHKVQILKMQLNG